VNIGQTVVASLNAPSLFLIAKDLTRMQVWVAVNEADIGKIHPGQAVTFTVDAFPGVTFTGSVGKVRLNASMTQNVVTYTVEIVTDNRDGRLLPYLTANVQFELQRVEDALLAPNTALRWRPRDDQLAPSYRETGATAASAGDRKDGKRRSATAGGRDNARGRRAVLWIPDGDYVRPVTLRFRQATAKTANGGRQQREEGMMPTAGGPCSGSRTAMMCGRSPSMPAPATEPGPW
ncbi:MAG: efflux RND transporter periplasmic adaptor subunit, partial [Desulfobacteraceae bacterium]